MNKYKLIKEYPDSEIIGTVVKLDELGVYSSENNSKYYKNNIENYPEFWEEIVEKDYLITAFCNKGTGAHRPINENGLYGYVDPLKHLDIMLQEGHEIFTVKRNNDGVEFKVGEKVLTAKDKFTIKEFKVSGNEILVLFNETFEHDGLYLISKLKQPLFITEDGIEKFEGDNYYYLRKHSWTFDLATANESFYNQDKLSDNSLYFSSKESVLEYVILNKPKYSLNDIEKAYNKTNSPTSSPLFQNFKSILLSK